MRCSLVSKILALLIANSLLLSAPIFAQNPREETRPRRTQDEWKPTATQTPITDGALVTRLEQEPTMRIALATDVRSATVSTNGRLMSATDVASTFMPLDVARVHVEPHLLSPLPVEADDESFRLRIAGLASRSEADENAKQIQKATGEGSQIAYD